MGVKTLCKPQGCISVHYGVHTVSATWVFPKRNPWISDCARYVFIRVTRGEEPHGYFLPAPERDVSGPTSAPWRRAPRSGRQHQLPSENQPPAWLVEIIRLGATRVLKEAKGLLM